ncbi:hypothetical protein GLOIN_2v1789202 [Rhizophagus irregularis DAOM 181602=DAOM 197198]|nr:hypothetical protein GLOIN_2v1789202 [Rhizophagus irregularis DAOM 181602=DAOM 197198]
MPIEWTRAATDHLIRQKRRGNERYHDMDGRSRVSFWETTARRLYQDLQFSCSARQILLSGEMKEVEVAGPEQASVTIGLSEADSGSSPALPDNVFNNVLSEDVNMEDINHGDNDNNELILLEDGVVTESSDDDNEEESSGEEEDNNDKEEGSSYEEEGSSYEEEGNNNEKEGNNNEDDCNNDEEEHNYDEEKVIYQSGDFVYYHDNGLQKLGKLRAILKDENGNYELRVQLILNYDDLPGNLKGLSRRRRSLTGEV